MSQASKCAILTIVTTTKKDGGSRKSVFKKPPWLKFDEIYGWIKIAQWSRILEEKWDIKCKNVAVKQITLCADNLQTMNYNNKLLLDFSAKFCPNKIYYQILNFFYDNLINLYYN